MKRKRKHSIGYIILCVVLALCCVAMLGVNIFMLKSQTASATTAQRYEIAFSYINTKRVSSLATGNKDTTHKEGSNVYSASVLNNKGNTMTFKAYLYSVSYTSTTQMANGGYISATTVNIEFNTTYTENTITVTKSDGTQVKRATSTTSTQVTGLVVGETYKVSYLGFGLGTGSTVSTSYLLDAWFTFKIDLDAPIISGCSTTQYETKTREPITISASDATSGIKRIYKIGPSSSGYYSNGQAVISSGSEPGLYKFYAYDNADNFSADYYVYFDDTSPTLTTSVGSFYSTVNQPFTVTATDTTTCKLYYMTPSMDKYEIASSNSFSVDLSDKTGKYYFYAIDELSNVSEVYWIQYNGGFPEYWLRKSSTDNRVYLYWYDSDITVTVNDEPYVKYDWIKEEGDYYAVAVNSYGKRTIRNFTIEHYYVASDVIAPTCVDKGYTVYICSQCGDAYNADFTDTTTHQYLSSVIEPNCEMTGYTSNVCKVCGYAMRTDYVTALGHSYNIVVTEPTCVGQGYSTYTCFRCNHSYVANMVSAKGHSYVETLVSPSCTEDGCVLHECIRCDYEYKTDIVPATGHTYTEESVEPTCTTTGGVNHTCVICGYVYQTGTIPAIGHSYTSRITIAATCGGEGQRTHTCENCGNKYTTFIRAKGHDYRLISENSVDGKSQRTYSCSYCGNTYTEEIGEEYEKVTNYVSNLFTRYSPYMIWAFLATAGVWSIFMGIMIILAKKNDDKEKAKRTLVNYLIGLVVIFCILVACPYLVNGIAVLVT